ncbi:hypothetical protein SOPP22_05380 [Shewanella sp. OPT22]|nr:hypothetical protein SOPP22_05380 [Shewanella sp. OPT22]
MASNNVTAQIASTFQSQKSGELAFAGKGSTSPPHKVFNGYTISVDPEEAIYSEAAELQLGMFLAGKLTLIKSHQLNIYHQLLSPTELHRHYQTEIQPLVFKEYTIENLMNSD